MNLIREAFGPVLLLEGICTSISKRHIATCDFVGVWGIPELLTSDICIIKIMVACISS